MTKLLYCAKTLNGGYLNRRETQNNAKNRLKS